MFQFRAIAYRKNRDASYVLLPALANDEQVGSMPDQIMKVIQRTLAPIFTAAGVAGSRRTTGLQSEAR